jgi:hypothetical protein
MAYLPEVELERALLDQLSVLGYAIERESHDEVVLKKEHKDDVALSLHLLLPGGDELPIKVEVSRLLYQLDREAHVEALNTASGASASAVVPTNQQG